MKRIALFVMLAACTLGVSAQEMISEEEAFIKKELNELKKDENIVCVEVVEYLADDSENTITLSQQKSMQLLQAHVIEIFAKRFKMDKKDVQEIMDVIDDKCQNVEIRKGDLLRVFKYILLDAARLSSGKVSQKEWDKYVGEAKKIDVKNMSAPVVPAADSEKEPEVKETADSTAGVSPVPTTPQPASTKTTSQPATTPTVAEPAVSEVTTPVTPTPQPVIPATTVEVKVPELCQTLLKQKDMTTLLKYLDTEKAYEKLIYGTERSMRRVADCYIVVVDKATKKIETVLDKGKADRMNFVTGQMDNFNNYRTGGKYQAVFVQPL